jgi:hypothetical protein
LAKFYGPGGFQHRRQTDEGGIPICRVAGATLKSASFGGSSDTSRLNRANRWLRMMTLIEIRPHRCGWNVFEAPGVEPVFPKKRQAIDYAEQRARA